jgi:hypothetical protein
MSDFQQKAAKAGEAIGDAASAGLKQGKALAESAGGVIGGLFNKAREKVESVLPGGDAAMTALKALVVAQDGLTTAITLGDETSIAIAKQTLAEAWAEARKVVAG